jgi:ApbE superfamily uncharacterized protein (UPF0280 family)
VRVNPQRLNLDANRQRWWHGPIDLIIHAEGETEVIEAAHARAWAEFQNLLATLVTELPLLRLAVQSGAANPCRGPVARLMWQACQPLAGPGESGFITPMAAVAGSVAQHLLRHYELPGVTRASINNGGDIALHLCPGRQWRLGVVSDISRVRQNPDEQELLLPDAQFTIGSDSPVRGVATSGWAGRSFSLGIADSVTVLAVTASQADAAASLIANQVNIEHPGIVRMPACDLKDDSDLGNRLVTRHVPELPLGQIMTALQRGLAYAQDMQRCGLIQAAWLVCQHQSVACGHEDGLQPVQIGVTSP